MSRVLVLATEDAASTARMISVGLSAVGIASDTVAVADTADLPAAVVRAGRVKPLYDAAIIVGNIDKSLEFSVTQVCEVVTQAVEQRQSSTRWGAPLCKLTLQHHTQT